MAVRSLLEIVVDCQDPGTLAVAVGGEVEDELGPFQVMLDPEGNEFFLVH